MSETASTPIEITIENHVTATWIDNTGIWTSDYFPHPKPEIEAYQLERGKTRLGQYFEQYKLIQPSVEIIDDEELSAIKRGAQLLRVTTFVIPYVDTDYLRPLVSLGLPAPTYQEVERGLVVRDLNAGGKAIMNTFASSMSPRP